MPSWFAQGIADQLVRRVAFRRAMKRAIAVGDAGSARRGSRSPAAGALAALKSARVESLP